MMKVVLLLLTILLVACSPYKFRYQPFQDNTPLQVAVPKGYNKVESGLDSAGNYVQTYHYSGDVRFYVQKVTNPSEWIDTAMHVAKIHPGGAVSFKWVEEGYHYWREVRTKNYRFGYANVPWKLEIRFDSAINHIRDQSFKVR